MPKGQGKVIAQNKKAHHDYFIEETYEAGIVLKGTEIKSIRNGRVNLKDAHARIDKNGEVQLVNMHIAEYTRGTALTMTRRERGNCSYTGRKSISLSG